MSRFSLGRYTYLGVAASFGRFLDDPAWAEKISTTEGAPSREMQILSMLKERFKARRAAKYMPDFAIMKPKADRVQMRLILGTHHVQGVEVFRTVQRKVEALQAETRRHLLTDPDVQPSIFPVHMLNSMELNGMGVGGHKSLIKAASSCLEVMNVVSSPIRFDVLAAKVMEVVAVRMTDMKDVVLRLRAAGELSFDLPANAKKPKDDTLVRLSCR